MTEPKQGLLTFRAEGNNIRGSKFYSRKIHFPENMKTCSGTLSGVTIGRGYDMGKRSESQVISDLLFSGIDINKAKLIAKGAGLIGCKAGEFVRKNRDEIGEITESQQVILFEKIYPAYEIRARNNYNHWMRKYRNAKKWSELSLPIKNVLVDFVYNGYTKSERPMLAGSNNNIKELILYIKSSPVLLSDEPGRNRISYLEGMQ
ncbi:hypothetical protein ABW286_11220 [Erwinia papayae]|uniref:Pesticin C-terminal domain-containing protein n=2 Tax=Erwinia TaxID=551 RepID=A0A014NPN5_9GAMM|nr:hypothetical protein [Erwinia mallotivora]EXU75765.1 hypothetical protein BG55_09075 [Erwinia mallotivora]